MISLMKIYNCIINGEVPEQSRMVNREFSTYDMFPTVLAALGYNIEKTNEIYNKINDISNIKPKRYYDFSDNVYTSIIKYGNK